MTRFRIPRELWPDPDTPARWNALPESLPTETVEIAGEWAARGGCIFGGPDSDAYWLIAEECGLFHGELP